MSDLMAASPMLKSPRCEAQVISPQCDGVRDRVLLSGTVKPVAELSGEERDQMHDLLVRYFVNASRSQFESDLAEKEWAIMLADQRGAVQGFSTLMRLCTMIDGRPAVAFFSGDTIIAREHWGATTLPRLWARHVFALAAAIQGARVYWFLICSGYRTYRFLPTFFREFYPGHERPTPAGMKGLMDELALQKFGRAYDAERGVIQFTRATPLREGVGEITGPRLQDAHIAFFAGANPGHASGDELVCLAELAASNLTVAGRRMLAATAALAGRKTE